MTHPEDLRLLRDTLLAHQRSSMRTPDCLDLEAIAAFAEGLLDSAGRARLLPHLAACESCRTAVAGIARALSDPSIAVEVRRLESNRGRRLLRIGGPIAAAAALAFLVLIPSTDQQDGVHRAPTIVGSELPLPLAPVGAVATVEGLHLSAVPGGDRYRVTLFDHTGAVLLEVESPDTVVTLPDSMVLSPGSRYLWRVEARTGFDRWAPSSLSEFTIVTPR